MRHKTTVDGRRYDVEVLRRVRRGPKAVSIVQPSHNALALTQAAIEAIRRWTRPEHELWIVDNFSSREVVEYLMAQPDINLILNRTPVGGWTWARRGGLPIPYPPRADGWTRIPGGGSYCNGLALELAAQAIDTDRMFVMHNDVLLLDGWLEFLLSKLQGRVRGAAISSDPGRVGAMHQSGFLFDFTLFKALSMCFMPKLPEYDAGDFVTIRLREAGHSVYVCQNTFNHPETLKWIGDETLRTMYSVRAFDEQRRVIALHLGRGTPKTQGTYQQDGKTGVSQWLGYAERHVVGGVPASVGETAVHS